MGRYSHSKISTFDQCRYKYKLAYIDMIRIDGQSIESFMGSLVHSTLERLYKDLEHNNLNSKEDLVRHFLLAWSKEWNDKITIVKKNFDVEYYKNLGLMFIMEYYDKYHPFNQLKTIDVETDEMLELDKNNKYYVKIDRLAVDENGNYHVIDYKTSSRIKNQTELDNDTQLAMYSYWVKNKFPDAKSIKLVWNFLAHNEERIVNKSDEELEKIKIDVENKIKEIEHCNEFPTNVSKLCDYCEYRPMCPEWKDQYKGEKPKYSKQKLLGEYI